MPHRSKGRKKSNFPANTVINDGAELDFFINGTNYKISKDDFIAALGATGTIVQEGDAGGTPILDAVGTENKIRNLEDGPGVKASVSPQNGATIEHNFRAGNGTATSILVDSTELSPLIRGLKSGSGIALGVDGDSIRISAAAAAASQTIIVNDLSDFPTPVAGVITLSDNTNYLISSDVDVGNNRFVLGSGTSVTGTSIGVSSIRSTTTGVLFTFIGSGFELLRELSLTATSASALFDIEASPPSTASFNIVRVISGPTATIGRFSNLQFFFLSSVGLVQGASGTGATFEGGFFLINIDSSVINGWNGTLYDFGTSTFTFLNIENENLISGSGSNVVVEGLPNSENVNPGGSAIVRASSLLGTVTPSSNIVPTDLQWEFSNNFGFPNSVSASYIAMPTNATETIISVANTPVKVAGLFTDVNSSRFKNDTTGRAEYVGLTPVILKIIYTFSYDKSSGTGTDKHNFYVAQNGVVLPNAVTTASTDGTRNPALTIATVVPNVVETDYFELWVEGDSTTDNVTVFAVNMVTTE